MTIVTGYLTKSLMDCLVVVLVVTPFQYKFDLYTIIGYILAFSLGFLLRIMVEWDANTLTWKKSIIQAVMGLVLCYLCVLMGKDSFPKFIKLEFCIFCCALFSIFIVNLGIKYFKIGAGGLARLLLKRLLAEDPKPEEDKL